MRLWGREKVDWAARDRQVLETALDQAREFPADHLQRWTSLEPVKTVEFGRAIDKVRALLQDGEASEALLGMQLLDTVAFSRGFDSVDWDEIGPVLARWCAPGQDPEVMAMALPMWLEYVGWEQERLVPLLRHPHPAVRGRAVRMLATLDGADWEQQLGQVVTILAEDVDPQVRAEAADGLYTKFLYAQVDGDPDIAGSIADCLREYRRDPVPAVRASVFAVLVRAEPELQVDWLAQELADPEVHPRFVQDSALVAPDPAKHPRRQQLLTALNALRDGGWPARTPDGAYPPPQERARLLDKAIDAFSG